MKKKKFMLATGLFFLTVSLIVFVFYRLVLPNEIQAAESRIRSEIDEKVMQKKKIAVVSAEDGITKYTVLTEEIIAKKIKMVEIPERYCASGAITDLGLLGRKICKEDFVKGEQITLDGISSENKWFGDFDRKKEYEVRSIVAGEVKAGNIIDVVVVYDNGDYDVVVVKTKALRVINPLEIENKSGGNAQQPSAVNPQTVKGTIYTVVISPRDEMEYRDLEMAKKSGKLETRLYVDESQPASRRTFDYTTAMKKAGLSTVTEKISN